MKHHQKEYSPYQELLGRVREAQGRQPIAHNVEPEAVPVPELEELGDEVVVAEEGAPHHRHHQHRLGGAEVAQLRLQPRLVLTRPSVWEFQNGQY